MLRVTNGWTGVGLLGAVALGFAASAALAGTIDLEWRPLTQTVNVGDPVGVGLFAVSNTGTNQPFNSAQVVMTWDTDFLQLIGVNQAGAVLNPAFGDSSGFPYGDSFGLNEATPPADGDGMWFGFVAIGQTRDATPAGSLLATIMFSALAETPGTPVAMLASMQKPNRPVAYTKVIQGTYDVLDTIGPPAVVTIIPEPGTMLLLSLAAVLGLARRR